MTEKLYTLPAFIERIEAEIEALLIDQERMFKHDLELAIMRSDDRAMHIEEVRYIECQISRLTRLLKGLNIIDLQSHE